jgi:hypothetical protein
MERSAATRLCGKTRIKPDSEWNPVCTPADTTRHPVHSHNAHKTTSQLLGSVGNEIVRQVQVLHRRISANPIDTLNQAQQMSDHMTSVGIHGTTGRSTHSHDTLMTLCTRFLGRCEKYPHRQTFGWTETHVCDDDGAAPPATPPPAQTCAWFPISD